MSEVIFHIPSQYRCECNTALSEAMAKKFLGRELTPEEELEIYGAYKMEPVGPVEHVVTKVNGHFGRFPRQDLAPMQ